jgi:hypothetical protein
MLIQNPRGTRTRRCIDPDTGKLVWYSNHSAMLNENEGGPQKGTEKPKD